MVTFADFDFTPEPDQIRNIYDSGFKGAMPGSSELMAYFRSGAPRFYDAFPQAKGLHTEVAVCLPIRGCQTLIDINFCADRGESQRQGDCVGKMVRNQGMIDGTLDHIYGETSWKMIDGKGVMYCCENHYGDRGHSGEGANCWRLWDNAGLNGPQGFLFRDSYQTSSGTYDLSRYRADLSGPWGRNGTPKELSKIAAKNPALKIYKAKSIEEVMDALCLGFGVGRCGSDGYSNTRDANGVSDVKGTWHHAIAVGGFDRTQRILDTYGGPTFLHYHNWGAWNNGPKAHEQPDGSWFVRRKFLEAHVRNGEVCILGNVVGVDRKLIWERVRDRHTQLRKDELCIACSS